jgi:hypothetical protein
VRLAAHLAITESALRHSITGRTHRKEPYPEHYEAAYRAWLTADAAHRQVCDTDIAKCVK